MFRILLAASASLMFAAASFSTAQAQQSYPMICKGGGAMQARIAANASIQLTFVPGTTTGDAQAGQCTWIDRGFRSGEPNTLSLRGNRRGMEYMLNGMLSGERFYVHGYNNGSGSMIITRIGP
jgi:hypothetical protein